MKTAEEYLKLFDGEKTRDEIFAVAADVVCELVSESMKNSAVDKARGSLSIEAAIRNTFSARKVWMDIFNKSSKEIQDATGIGLFDGVCAIIVALPEEKRRGLFEEAMRDFKGVN